MRWSILLQVKQFVASGLEPTSVVLYVSQLNHKLFVSTLIYYSRNQFNNMLSKMNRDMLKGNSWISCSLPPRHLCLFTGEMFEQTDFLLAVWPSACFICREKKKSVCPLLWYHYSLTWCSGYTGGEVLHCGCRTHRARMKCMVYFVFTYCTLTQSTI